MKLKLLYILLPLIAVVETKAQNVGIGTTTPAVRLDVLGANAWDLVNGEGDFRIGNATTRLKIGVALGGGGAGNTGIMQAGGIANLELGAGNKYFLQLNGASNFINLKNISGGLRIEGNSGTPGQILTSNGSDASPQWSNPAALPSPQSALTGSLQVFDINSNNLYTSSPINITIPPNADVLLWFKIRVFKSCVIGPCLSGFELNTYLDGAPISSPNKVVATVMPDMLENAVTVGPMVINNSSGVHAITFTIASKFGNPYSAFFNPTWVIVHK